MRVSIFRIIVVRNKIVEGVLSSCSPTSSGWLFELRGIDLKGFWFHRYPAKVALIEKVITNVNGFYKAQYLVAANNCSARQNPRGSFQSFNFKMRAVNGIRRPFEGQQSTKLTTEALRYYRFELPNWWITS